MKEPEKILKEITNIRVPDSLDSKVYRSLDDAVRFRRTPVLLFPVPLWACTATCLLFLVLGLIINKSEAMPEPVNATTITYVVQSEPDRVFKKIFVRNKKEQDYFLRKKEIINGLQSDKEKEV